VANAIRLLNLPEELMKMLKDGEISAGHARALLAYDNLEDMLKAGKLAAEGMTVRQIEKMSKPSVKKSKSEVQKHDSYFSEVEISLTQHLGRKVKVMGNKNKGTLEIEFYGEEDLTNLANLFAGK